MEVLFLDDTQILFRTSFLAARDLSFIDFQQNEMLSKHLNGIGLILYTDSHAALRSLKLYVFFAKSIV